MNVTGTALLLLAAVFIAAWLATAVVIFVRALRSGGLFQRGNLEIRWPKRLLLAVCALPLILLLAAATIVNTTGFFAALCWYRLRGKPLPAEPPPRRRRADRAA